MTESIVGRYELGDFQLQSEVILEDAFLGFRSYGSLNELRDNVIVFPTWYTGLNDQIAPYIGPGKALDPEKYFIVIPDMFTNGSSSSPSNSAEPIGGLISRWSPHLTMFRLRDSYLRTTLI